MTKPMTQPHLVILRPSFQASVKSSELMRATNTLVTPFSSKLRLAAATLDLLTSVATTWGSGKQIEAQASHTTHLAPSPGDMVLAPPFLISHNLGQRQMDSKFHAPQAQGSVRLTH